MQRVESGDFWETAVDGLEVVRWTAASGGATLVRLRLTNETDETIVTRIVDEVPDTVTNAVLITTTSDTPDSWRRTRDHVIHEFVLPGGGKRTTAYLLRSDADPLVTLEEPIVESVTRVPEDETGSVDEHLEPLEDASTFEDEHPSPAFPRRTSTGESQGSSATPIDRDERMSDAPTDGASGPSRGETSADSHEGGETNRAESTDDPADVDVEPADSVSDPVPGTTEETPRSGATSRDDATSAGGDRAGETGAGSDDEAASIVDRLVVALEDEATPAQRRALRSQLGASESERARLKHVQSRLGDFAAYVDALEALVDEHGIDVVDEMRAGIDANASTTRSLEDELGSVRQTVESHRTETEEMLEALENELTATRSGLYERLENLEATLNTTRSELAELRNDVEDDRQTRAREVRRFDESISELEDTVDRLEADVRENDAFRRRFTAAFSSAPASTDEDDGSTTAVEHEPTTGPD